MLHAETEAQVAGHGNEAEDQVPALAVRRIALTGFRNYASLRLEVDASPVVLTGPNGAGKTNLLEAISFLSPGRGLRRARLADVAQRSGPGRDGGAGDGNWAVAATLDTPDGPVDVGTGREVLRDGDVETDRRVVRIDGAPAKSQTELGRLFVVSWLTPEMDRLFLEGASGRRRFIDRLIYGFVPDHSANVSTYERAMRERARLLREGRGDRSWIAALEAQMSEAGIAIAAARRDVVGRLSQAAEQAIGPFPQPRVTMDGTVEGWLESQSALEAEDRFKALLEASRRRDAEAGGAADGPHRSDLSVIHAERNVPAATCSTGEQKALLISLVLAASRLQALDRAAAPVLLMDEVAAHLDERRRAALFDELTGLGSQAWLSGTDALLFEALRGRAQFLEVAAGGVSAAETK